MERRVTISLLIKLLYIFPVIYNDHAFFLIFTYFIKSLKSVIIIKYTFCPDFYITVHSFSLRNIVYIYHQTIKSNNSSVTAPVSTDIFFINYIIRKYTAVNWAFKNVFYKIWTYNISFTECFFFYVLTEALCIKRPVGIFTKCPLL